jgi:hypothetical protein
MNSQDICITKMYESFQTFLKENGYDLEKMIRKEVKQKLLKKRNKLLEKKNEEIAQHIFILQDRIAQQINNYYNHNITDLTADWYIENQSLFMTFNWMDQQITIYAEDGKPIIDSCPKKLHRFLQRQDSILEFMLLDQEYYTLSTIPL